MHYYPSVFVKKNYSNAYNLAFPIIIFLNVLLCIKLFINVKIYTHGFVHILSNVQFLSALL